LDLKVLTAVTMKSTIVCDVTPCSPAEVHGVTSQEITLQKYNTAGECLIRAYVRNWSCGNDP
jgi:hypothetical protein